MDIEDYRKQLNCRWVGLYVSRYVAEISINHMGQNMEFKYNYGLRIRKSDY